jgi:hypothetical protein
MVRSFLARWWQQVRKQNLRQHARRGPRLGIERLEERTVLSTLLVVNSADNGPGSLRDTIANAASGDTILFSHRLEGQTITLTSGQLALTKDLSIVGLGANDLAVSGNAASRILAIASGTNVSVSGLTLTEGLSDQGGGIDNAGTLTLDHCAVTANVAQGDSTTTGQGGAVFNEPGATLKITQSLFRGNQVSGGMLGIGFGGGLMNFGTATITGSRFSANQAAGGGSAYGAGGAIANQNGANLAISGCTFDSNVASTGQGFFAVGGAIDNDNGIYPQGAAISVTDSTFTGNQAQGGAHTSLGGALFSFLGSLNVARCLFQNNQVTSSYFAESGALDNEDCPATISDSRFLFNQAIGSAGGSTAAGALTNLQSTMTLTNCALLGNAGIGGDGANGSTRFGESNGGAILNYQGMLQMSQCSLTGNLARGGNNGDNTSNTAVGAALGGGIFNYPDSTLTVSCSSFTGNQAISGTIGVGYGPLAIGGGIDSDVGSTLTVDRSTFTANRVVGGNGSAGYAGGIGFGGAIVNQFSSVATITNSVFLGNQAQGGAGGTGGNGGDGVGGGLVNGHPVGFETLADTASLTLTNCLVLLNVAQGGTGGAGANGGDGLGGGIEEGLLDGPSAPSMTMTSTSIGGNVAVGGTSGAGGTGGNGQGGGVYVANGASACFAHARIVANIALGGSGSTSGQGVGGGLYIVAGANVGGIDTVIAGDHASTSNDDIFGVFKPTC